MNRRWGTRFWSHDYIAWGQLRLAGDDMAPAARLDTRRFRSDTFLEFATEQTAILRARHPGALITTNGMGPIFEPIDYYKLYAPLDRASGDQYYDIADMPGDALGADLFRGYKSAPWWMTETGSGALTADKVPTAGQLRAWAYSALARGCEAWCFFRWRTCLSGQEQELQGVIEHSGKPRRRYAAVQALFAELESLAPRFADLPLPTAQVAFIQDYDVIMGYKSSVINGHVQYKKHVQDCYLPFFHRNVAVDFIPPERALDGYRMVVLPSLAMVDAPFAERLRAFVAGGGVVLATPQLACRDRCISYLPATPPVGLTDLFGLRVEGGMYLRSFVGPDQALWFPAEKYARETPAVRVTRSGSEFTGTVHTWMEDIELQGGEAVGTFTDNDFAGSPAIIRHAVGAGTTCYCAAYPSAELLDALVDELLPRTGVVAGPAVPEYVEVLRRGDCTFVINHRNAPVTVPLAADRALVGTYHDGVVSLAPHDVCVLIDTAESV